MAQAMRRIEALGSVIEIKMPTGRDSLFQECFDELKRIEARFSRFKSDSELSKLNSNLGVWQDASGEMIYLISKGIEFGKLTGGNFDIALKGRLDDLGYDKDYSLREKSNGAKDKGEIPDEMMPPIILDQKKKSVLLNREIEFGGFGKGYAQDMLSKLLEDNGIPHYCINAGGDVYAKRGDGEDAWKIMLEHPDDPQRAIGVIELDGKSLAASAPNRRKWGKSHHLLNSKTGMPQMGVKAIFVVAKTGIEADAYATALFTAGFEEGTALSKELPAELLLVSAENKIFQSMGFKMDKL